jgi:hypothetical protein
VQKFREHVGRPAARRAGTLAPEAEVYA